MTRTTLPSSYDPFAWIYNRHWGDSFLPVLMPVIENMALRQLPPRARILDLCCGTGQLARELTRLGYRVTGIDGSAEMLRYARENAPGVKFIQADARAFRLPEKYDAVISAFDSLNHVMKLKELATVFQRAYDSLRPGGMFLFDLNTEEGFRLEWQGDFNIIEDDHVCVVFQTYREGRRVATFDITIFRLMDGSWYRTDVKLFQKCHAPTRIKSELAKAGFTSIEICGFDWQAGLKPLTGEARRAFFQCRKPA